MQFNPESFIKRLLGLGDIKGLWEKVNDILPIDEQNKFEDMVKKGKLTLRNMKDQYTYIMKMGPINKVMEMIPGMSDLMPEGGEKEASIKIKKFLCIMDSMTNAELDNKVKIDENRMKRIAKGSGNNLLEVKILLEEYKKFSKIMGRMGGISRGKGGELSQIQRNPKQFMEKLGGMLPQNLLNQMGGTGGIMNMIKEFESVEGLQKLNGLKRKIKK